MKEKQIIAILRTWQERGKIGKLAEITLLAGFAHKLTTTFENLIPNIKRKWRTVSPEKREKIILKLYELLQLLESEEIKGIT